MPEESQTIGEARCPVCGQWVDLVAEAYDWERQDDGSWKIVGYGPGIATHCGLLLAETDYEGTVGVFKVEKR